MPSSTVRIDETDLEVLRSLAQDLNLPMSAVIRKALWELKRREFLIRLNADFARLRGDKAAWEEELAERRLWDNTLMDGLEEE